MDESWENLVGLKLLGNLTENQFKIDGRKNWSFDSCYEIYFS